MWPKCPWAFSDVIHCPEVLCKRIRVSELHLTASSLVDALLTSSLPCASVSNVLTPAAVGDRCQC